MKNARSAPSAAELLAKANKLEPFFFERAAENEVAGRLLDETVAALVDNGFTGAFMPACFGGSEVWPTEALEIVEALSYSDGSTGWVLMAWQVAMAAPAAYLPGETADALFSDTLPLMAGQGGPIGRADAVDGGYMLSGNWRYGSGLLHAEYIHSGAVVHENGKPRLNPGNGLPETRVFITPVSQSDLQSEWDVLGLRATGSIDYEIRDLFVPEVYTHPVMANTPNRGGDFYRISIPGMASIGHSGFALGVGRRVLDELAQLANEESSRSGMISPPGGNDSFQELYGAAEAKFRSARAFVFEAQGGVQHAVQSGNDPSTRQITLARLALQNVNTSVSDICAFAYKYGGGVSLRESPIQRCLRDMYAGIQHHSNFPPIIRNCARELLGLDPGKVWGPRSLINPPQ
jgi:alkylation response protein AidB-like acyl-CoA dehydrogenase